MSEESLQISVCNYIKYQYQNIIFFSDASGIRVSIGAAVKMKKMRSGRAIPDLFIAEKRSIYAGLFLELKVISPFKKDGKTLKSGEHLMEQWNMINNLRKKGYAAYFVTGFDEAKREIDYYLIH